MAQLPQASANQGSFVSRKSVARRVTLREYFRLVTNHSDIHDSLCVVLCRLWVEQKCSSWPFDRNKQCYHVSSVLVGPGLPTPGSTLKLYYVKKEKTKETIGELIFNSLFFNPPFTL